MNPTWINAVEIGTAESSGTWTYSPLKAGIESMEFAENEQNQQFFFLDGEGFAENEVTGSAPELVISGRRKVGDAAQDYIAGLQFKHGSERKSSIKITAEGKVITCGCTIGAITSFGGATLDINAFGCTIRLNGKPTVTNAT